LTAKATCNGTITATGGANCTSRGFEWGLVQGGPYPNTWTESGDFGTGAFSHQFTGLAENTLHYYRAKAQNPVGWGYGGEQSFTTWKAVGVSDTGAGVEATPQIEASLSIADAAAGDDVVTVEGPGIIDVTDEGAGVDTIDIAAAIDVPETAAGTEIATLEASIPSSDSGVGADTPSLQNQLTETDAGIGSETAELSAGVSATESGAGVDVQNVQASIPISDSGVGSEVVSPPSVAMTIADSGLGDENVTTPSTLTVFEKGKGAEFAWRTKPSNPMIDALVLPHVLSIRISDPATMSDKKVQGGSLPRRTMVGKPGRTAEIEGWSDDQSEIDALDALRDGVRRTFYHPSGDSFGVLVTGFEPSRTVDQYNRRLYRLAVAEAN
jgi:hypothetical protein